MKIKSICAFCSSSNALEQSFYDIANDIGKSLAERNITLVYGGANVGIMNSLAISTKSNGGKVIGVIPEVIKNKGLAFNMADELIVTPDLRERKKKMESLSDAFLVLPGGFGTLEEALEVMTLKQLNIHSKPIVFYNHNNFFNSLFLFFKQLADKKIMKPEYLNIYHVSENIDGIFNFIEEYEAPDFSQKWFIV